MRARSSAGPSAGDRRGKAGAGATSSRLSLGDSVGRQPGDATLATVAVMSSAPRRRRAASYRSLWRLRSYVRPYCAQMVAMLVCATLAVVASTLIPLVLEAVVNGPIQRGDRAELVPMFFIALGLGTARGRPHRRPPPRAVGRHAEGGAGDPRRACMPTCSGCRSSFTTAGRRASCSRVRRRTSERFGAFSASAPSSSSSTGCSTSPSWGC